MKMNNSEIIFLIEESNEGGYEARSIGHSIFTEADDLDELKANIKDAVQCHFWENNEPGTISIKRKGY